MEPKTQRKRHRSMFVNKRLSGHDKSFESLLYFNQNNSLPLDFLMLVEKMPLKQFLNVFQQLGIYFFDDPEVFSENSKKIWYVKYVVWKLEKGSRLLLQSLVCRLIKEEQRPLLYEMLYDKNRDPHPLYIRSFLHTLFTNHEKILNSVDVLMYSPDGELIGMLEDVHWESMFEVGELCTTIFVIQSMTYMSPTQFLQKVIEVYMKLEEERFFVDEKVLRKKTKRLEDIVLTWTSFFKEETEECVLFKQQVLDSIIFSHDLFIADAQRKIRNNLLYVPPQKNAMLMGFMKCTPQNFLIELDVEKSFIRSDAKTSKLYNIKSKYVAQQIVMFDQELLGGVRLLDSFSSKKFTTLEKYSLMVSMFEVLTTKTLEAKVSKKTVSFFVKVSYELKVLGNFNISCLIYSALSSCLLKDKKLSKCFSALKIGVKKKFFELKELYSISHQSQMYRKQFEEHTQPKMPVIAFFVGDNIRLEEINNHIGTSPKMLNTFKLEKVGVLIDLLYNAREIHYVFSVIQPIRCYFMSLIRIMC